MILREWHKLCIDDHPTNCRTCISSYCSRFVLKTVLMLFKPFRIIIKKQRQLISCFENSKEKLNQHNKSSFSVTQSHKNVETKYDTNFQQFVSLVIGGWSLIYLAQTLEAAGHSKRCSMIVAYQFRVLIKATAVFGRCHVVDR